MNNAIKWFEIPSKDFEKAVTFYGDITGKALNVFYVGGFKMAMFDYDEGGVIIYSEEERQAQAGSAYVLDNGEELEEVIHNIESNGGKIVILKMQIGDKIGFLVQFMDTDGNMIGLHPYR